MKVWVFTKQRQRRAVLEGWYFFDSDERGTEVQRIDSQDEPQGAQLENDDQAIALARKMGAPVDKYGHLKRGWHIRGLT